MTKDNENIHVLFIADLVGPHAYDILASVLPQMRNESPCDLIIANGENASNGRGLTDVLADNFYGLGIHVLTSGNHIWQKQKSLKKLKSMPYLLRPANYPPECPGNGTCIYETAKGRIGIINLQGRSFMYPIDCPFRKSDELINEMQQKGVRHIIVDFHAEATAEKIALGYYLDGRVSAVIGTHTHVQTADEQILPKDTAYITDAGMTGSMNSVIGMQKEAAIRRFITQMPVPYQSANDCYAMHGVSIYLDKNTGKANKIERVRKVIK